jgi:protein TonB
MKHFWGCLGLSIALHLSAGWLVREIQAAPEPLAFQPPMAIQLVTLAPIALPAPAPPQPVRALAPTSTSAPAPTPVKEPATTKAEPATPAPTPVKPLPVSTRPSIVKAASKPQPAPKSQADPRRAEPLELPATVAKNSPAPAAPSATVPAQNTQPATPVAAAPAPMLSPVVSLRPSFVTPPPAPRYPTTARRRNQQGVVRVEVRLDERGQQLKLTLVRSSGVESLDQAALEAVTTWRFRPEIVDGRAVPSRVEIPIEFALTANR